jgi:hypothetical protein
MRYRPRRIRQFGHVYHVGDMRNANGISVESLNGRDHWEDNIKMSIK